MNPTELLIKHEGFRQFPYKDTRGILTVGIGRNLETVGIREKEARFLLGEDLRITEDLLKAKLSPGQWARWDDVRKAVLLNMAFNLGVAGLFSFEKMILALQTDNWDRAATEMLDSLWAKQVGNRAVELSEMMKKGDWI